MERKRKEKVNEAALYIFHLFLMPVKERKAGEGGGFKRRGALLLVGI